MAQLNTLADMLEAGVASGADSSSSPVASPGVMRDGQRFSELLQTGGSGIEEAGAIPPIKQEFTYTNTIGDAILSRLDAMGTSFRSHVERTHKMIEATPEAFSLRDLIKLQLEMASVSLEIEVVGKGVQKAVQHADQLSKLQ